MAVPNFWLLKLLKNILTFSVYQEESKSLRKRNTKVFTEILDSMPSLTHCTTWSEASQMLLDNPRFTEDPDLHSK